MLREPDCCSFEADLTAFVQGELPADRSHAVKAHVDQCKACSGAISGLRSVLSMASDVEDLAPSLRFKRRMQAILDSAGDPVKKAGFVLRLRSAGAFLLHRLRTSSRFRLATVSVGVHVILLLALPFVILPGIADKGSGKFAGRFENTTPLGPDSELPDESSVTISTEQNPSLVHPTVKDTLRFADSPRRTALTECDLLPPIERVENRLPRPVFANDLVPDRKIALLASQLGDGALAYRAISGALSWLAGSQSANGSWGGGDSPYGTGVTASALLAFLSDGNSQERGRQEWRATVTKAVDRLLSDQVQQGPLDGLIGPAAGHYTYNHALATLALCEAWSLDRHRMRAARAGRLRSAIIDAVTFVQRTQTPQGGWRYTLEDARGSLPDTSVSIFMMMSLVSARGTGIAIPKLEECVSRFTGWLRHVTGAGGIVGYQSPDDRTDHPRTLTAGALYLEELLGLAKPLRARQARAVLAELKDPAGSAGRNSLLRFYSALAFRIRGESVLPLFGRSLLDTRGTDGSWSAAGDLHGFHGGDVFQTALNVLTLTTSYRWAS